MKLNKTDNRNIKSQKPLQRENVKSDVKTDGKDKVDAFKQAVYYSGKNLLEELNVQNVEYNKTAYEEALKHLNVLEKFQYNIAFAGEQSSGKSTIINALVEYPIMPTCQMTTTCVGTKMIYSQKTRIIVTDDDSQRIVMDVDCTNLSDKHFRKLKEYACVESGFKLIENLQHFTDRNLFNTDESLSLSSINELELDRSNPNHIALLLMILLTVYVDQNSVELSPEAKKVIDKRNEVLKFFNFPLTTLNYSITLLWDNEFLKNGMVITDLPGLGAYAPDKKVNGKVQKGHDAITVKALGGSTTDAMVFLVDPQVTNSGAAAIEAMLSNASLREMVGDDIIIPVINKIDSCHGDAEVLQAITGFVNLIKGAGANKSEEDVKLCSSWFGEARYSDIPLERTLYYKRHFATVYNDVYEDILESDDDVNQQEIIRKTKVKLAKRLEKAYKDKSYIEELKQFFRLSYVQKGKCYKIYAALFKVITFSETTYNDLVSKKDSVIALQGLQSGAIDKITAVVKDYAAKPINTTLRKIGGVTESRLEIMDDLVKSKLQAIPGKYSSAFDSAVSEYKERLLKIANDFEIYAWGLGSQARIDIDGSKNRNLYFQLKRECNIMKIDIKSINECYAETLKRVAKDITGIYNTALEKLREMKKSFSKTMQEAVEKILEDKKMQDNSEAIRTLAGNITDYVEKNISIIENKSKVSKLTIDEVGKTIANSIINFNEECVSSFSLSVVNQVQGALAAGRIFRTRQFIIVDGSNGIKALFGNLSYSSEDKTFMENKITVEGTDKIYNKVTLWYSDASTTIRDMFTDLIDQIQKLLDSTVDMLKKGVDENKNTYGDVVRQISVCQDELVKFRSSVQELLDWSLQETRDSRLSAYQNDMFGSLNLQG